MLKAIEYIVMGDMLQTKCKHVKVAQCLKSLLNWTIPATDSTKLAQCFLDGLMMSIKATLPQGKSQLLAG